jgi:hexosaminidase
MLARMTEWGPTDALKTLGDIVESVERLGRGRLRAYTSLTPMNRLTDAVAPESDLAREFNRRVELALADQAALSEQAPVLRAWLTKWRDNDARLQPSLGDSFLLSELESISRKVSNYATAGLQALDWLEAARRPPESWTGEQASLLQQVDRPDAELLIMILPGVRRLVEGANQLR